MISSAPRGPRTDLMRPLRWLGVGGGGRRQGTPPPALGGEHTSSPIYEQCLKEDDSVKLIKCIAGNNMDAWLTAVADVTTRCRHLAKSATKTDVSGTGRFWRSSTGKKHADLVANTTNDGMR